MTSYAKALGRTRAILLTPAFLVAGPLAAQILPPAKIDMSQRFDPALFSQTEALQLAQGTLAACEAQGETASVLVVDANGYLRAGLSSDRGVPIGLQSASLKAATVLAFRKSTRLLGEQLRKDPAFAAQYEKDARYFWHPGALPLFRGTTFAGVLAVGGGHDKDEGCALTALKAFPQFNTGG